MLCFPDSGSNSILNKGSSGVFTLQHLLLDTLELQPLRGHTPCLWDVKSFGWELFVKERKGGERGGEGGRGRKKRKGGE